MDWLDPDDVSGSLDKLIDDVTAGYHRAHEQMEDLDVRLGNERHQGINPDTMPVWTATMAHMTQEFSELQKSIKANIDLQSQIDEAQNSLTQTMDLIENIEIMDGRLKGLEPMNDVEVHEETVSVVREFLSNADDVIPDLQFEGLDLGAESRSTVRILRRRLDDVSSKYDVLRRQQTSYADSLMNLKADFIRMERRLAVLRDELQAASELRDSHDDLQVKCKNMITDLSQSRQTIQDQSERLENLETNCHDLKLQLDESASMNADLRSKSERQANAQEAADRERDTLKQSLLEADEDNANLKESYDTTRSNLDLSKAEVDELGRKLQAKEAELDSAHGDLAKLRKDLQEQNQNLAQVLSSEQQAKADLRIARAESDAQANRISESEKLLEQARNELQGKSQTLEEHQRLLRDNKAELDTSEAALSQATDEKNQLKQQLNDIQAKYDELIASSQAQHMRDRDAFERVKRERIELSEELGSVSQKLTTRTNEIEQWQTSYRDQTQKLAMLEHENLLQAAQTSIGEDDVRDLISTVDRLREQLGQQSQQRIVAERRIQEESRKLANVRQQLMQTTADLDVTKGKVQDISNVKAEYQDMIRLFSETAQELDLPEFEFAWRESRTLNLMLRGTPRGVCEIHGLTSGLQLTSAQSIALQMLAQACSNVSQSSVAGVHQFAELLFKCDENSRRSALAIWRAFIHHKYANMRKGVASFATSLILLRGIEILSCWIDPTCQVYQDIAAMTMGEMSVDVSSPLVRSLLYFLRKRFEGKDIPLVTALCSETVLKVDRSEHDGYTFVKEASGLIIVTPEQDMIYARYSGITLVSQPATGTIIHSDYSLVFVDCPLLGTWKTSWWTLDQFWDIAVVFEHVAKPEEGETQVKPSGENLLHEQ